MRELKLRFVIYVSLVVNGGLVKVASATMDGVSMMMMVAAILFGG